MEIIDYEKLDLKAFPGAFSTYDAQVLVPEVIKLGEGDIYLEVGVDKGKSLSIMQMVAKKGVILEGVDIALQPDLVRLLAKKGGTRITFYQGDSVKVASKWNTGKISIMFIDGDHSYQGCKRDIEAWYPHMKEGGVMFFHDCDESSPGVVQAVSEFVNTHTVNKWELYKRTDRNTSMSGIWL